jgi:hypothetical protein
MSEEELTTFVEGYRAALSQGPRVLAALYAEPCVTAQKGIVRVHATREEIERRADDLHAGYRTRGVTHGDVRSVEVRRLGADSALAVVRWAFMGACDELLWTTTCSYELYRYGGAWKIVVETVHEG